MTEQKRQQTYLQMVRRQEKDPKVWLKCLNAFWIGGLICVLGEVLKHLYSGWGLGEDGASLAVTVSLIFLSVLATGLGLYPRLAVWAGAGTLVPITGFANAMASCAIENKTEGFILGTGAQMFRIAGPVIAYGTLASVVYGAVYWAAGAL